jgi:CheY-like chemotaxis protein
MKRKPKILFVDDDPDDLEFYGESMLKVLPELQIVEMPNGIKALEYLRQINDKILLPCLIVLDVNMPLMSGKETLSEIRKIHGLESIPVVIFSTASNPAEKDFFKKFEVEFFTKPSSFSEMQVIAQKLVGYCC